MYASTMIAGSRAPNVPEMAQCMLCVAERGIDLTRAEWRSQPGQHALAMLKERREAFQVAFAQARFAVQTKEGPSALQHALCRVPLDVIDRIVLMAQLKLGQGGSGAAVLPPVGHLDDLVFRIKPFHNGEPQIEAEFVQ